MVWDSIRRKFLVLTPEEWVRQHLIHFLQNEFDIPSSAIALESGLNVAERKGRSDILVYKNQKPQILVECKAPQVTISQETFDQAARYNQSLDAPYLLISNGLEHYYARQNNKAKRFEFLAGLPSFRLME
jgi:hypothetical protein